MSRLDEIKRESRQMGKMSDPPIFYREVCENDFQWLIEQAERVDELEEENRSLNREIGKWSNHVWAIAEESFVVRSKAKQLLNEMIKGESE